MASRICLSTLARRNPMICLKAKRYATRRPHGALPYLHTWSSTFAGRRVSTKARQVCEPKRGSAQSAAHVQLSHAFHLHQSDRSADVDSANAGLNGTFSSIAKATDPSFAAAVVATRASLGHAIDFGNQGDREALGRTIAAAAAKANLTCIGSRVGACGCLSSHYP